MRCLNQFFFVRFSVRWLLEHFKCTTNAHKSNCVNCNAISIGNSSRTNRQETNPVNMLKLNKIWEENFERFEKCCEHKFYKLNIAFKASLFNESDEINITCGAIAAKELSVSLHLFKQNSDICCFVVSIIIGAFNEMLNNISFSNYIF